MTLVGLEELRAAQQRIAGVAVRTPLVPCPWAEDGTRRLWLKPENLQPTGAFKTRGAYNRLAALTEAERARGVVAQSSGNHAQAVAYAAQVLGIKAVIVMEGINDIGTGLGSSSTLEPVSLEALQAADRQVIARAHERGVRVIGATLTPYQGAFYASPAGEMVREARNHWIRSSGEFDGVIDFAPAVADAANPLAFDKRYNDTDHLHPNDAGYKMMADAIDLSLILK